MLNNIKWFYPVNYIKRLVCYADGNWILRFSTEIEFDTSPGAIDGVCSPYLIRPVTIFSPERRRNLPGRGGDGIFPCGSHLRVSASLRLNCIHLLAG